MQTLALGWGYASLNTASVQADHGQGLTYLETDPGGSVTQNWPDQSGLAN